MGTLLLFCVWFVLQAPSLSRDWEEGYVQMPSAEINGNRVVISGIRDFYRDKDGNNHHNWKTETFDLNMLEGVDFVVSHFSDFQGAAHTFLTFRFSDGKYLPISAEIRREKGDEFSALKGLFQQFEITYLVGTERDIIGSRIGYRNEDVYLYPTTADKKQTRQMLLLLLKKINYLSENPEFYNTLTNNCTNVVVGVAEDVIGKNIWWSFSHFFVGYSDKKAYELGFFDTHDSFEDFKEKQRISGRGISQWDKDLSEKIRALPLQP